MNNNGFSLIELLTVIALLAIILLIFTPNITNMINNFRDVDQVEMLKNSAISAAKEYVVDGKLLASNITCGENSILISTLISSNYLESNDWYRSGDEIIVTYDCNNKKFTEYKYCIKAEDGNCKEN